MDLRCRLEFAPGSSRDVGLVVESTDRLGKSFPEGDKIQARVTAIQPAMPRYPPKWRSEWDDNRTKSLSPNCLLPHVTTCKMPGRGPCARLRRCFYRVGARALARTSNGNAKSGGQPDPNDGGKAGVHWLRRRGGIAFEHLPTVQPNGDNRRVASS